MSRSVLWMMARRYVTLHASPAPHRSIYGDKTRVPWHCERFFITTETIAKLHSLLIRLNSPINLAKRSKKARKAAEAVEKNKKHEKAAACAFALRIRRLSALRTRIRSLKELRDVAQIQTHCSSGSSSRVCYDRAVACQSFFPCRVFGSILRASCVLSWGMTLAQPVKSVREA